MVNVQVRFLSSETLTLQCTNVASIMVQIAQRHADIVHYATDVIVIDDTGTMLLDYTQASPSLVMVLLKVRGVDREGVTDVCEWRELKVNLCLHAEYGDERTCARVLAMLERRNGKHGVRTVVDVVLWEYYEKGCHHAKEEAQTVTRTLLAAGADASHALIHAAGHGRSQVVKTLLLCNAPLTGAGGPAGNNAEQPAGFTALIFACRRGHEEIVESLISSNMRVDEEDNGHNTPLMWACAEGHAGIVTRLIDAKADVNHVNQHGTSALLCSSNRTVVEKLISAGAAVNHTDRRGTSALIASIRHDSTDLLLAAKADVRHVDDRNSSAADHAVRWGQLDLAMALRLYELEEDRDTCAIEH